MEDNAANLKMYFDKLVKTIETQATFKFGNKRIVDKQRIDDILCCIDVNFPTILKNFHKKYQNLDKNVKSFKDYEKLIANIKIKPLLSNNGYSVNYNEVLQLVSKLGVSIASDIKYIQQHYPDIH